MKSKKFCLKLMVLSCFAGLTACGPKTPQERSARIQEKVKDKLELTEAQSASFGKVADAMVNARESLRADRQQMYDKVESLIAADAMSSDDVMAVVNPKLEQIRKEAQVISQTLAEFHGTLTPDQRAELVKLLAKLKQHHLKK